MCINDEANDKASQLCVKAEMISNQWPIDVDDTLLNDSIVVMMILYYWRGQADDIDDDVIQWLTSILKAKLSGNPVLLMTGYWPVIRQLSSEGNQWRRNWRDSNDINQYEMWYWYYWPNQPMILLLM